MVDSTLTLPSLQDAPPVPGWVGMVNRVVRDPTARKRVDAILADLFAQQHPFSADRGNHHPRASDMGACSLEYVAKVHGLLDLPESVDAQLIKDNGTFFGMYVAAFILSAIDMYPDEYPYAAVAEAKVNYLNTPGTIDLHLVHHANPYFGEVLEVKSTPGSGQIKPPDERKLYQCLQAGHYALAKNAARFSLLTFGYNVGDNKDGFPHPKLVAHMYATADFKQLVDDEIARLTALKSVNPAALDDDTMRGLADNTSLCGFCRFSKCLNNKNQERFAL